MKEYPLKSSDSLSQRAKSRYNSPDPVDRDSEPGLLRLIHELEVHQVEIELQNEELRQAEEKARRAREKFSALYDYAPMGYFTMTREGILKDLNFSAAEMLSDKREHLKNQCFQDYVSAETRSLLKDFLQNIFQNVSKQTCEIIVSVSNQPPIFLYLEGVPFAGPAHCLITAVDITQRKKTEKALIESEARLRDLNATKDKFFSIISHDLKNPFASIIGLSNLLKNKVAQSQEEAESYAGYIQESAYRAMDLLDNLLTWSSTQTGKMRFNPQKTELNALVHETVELLRDSAHQKNIRIYMQTSQQVPAWADVTMVSTILRNLLSNAIKFTHPEGKIIVSSQSLPGELLVSVSDTGTGMDKETREKLFQNGEGYSTRGTRNESGTGLGLLLAREFILMHGGNIWVESEPDQGSTFFFTLPEKDG